MSELIAWYREGQDNVVAWLEGGPDDDTLDNNISLAMQRRFALWCLARNLRDAAGCALAFGLGDQSRHVPGGLGWMPLDEYWGANLDGRAAPGWER